MSDAQLLAMARLAAEETEKRLKWEAVTTAFLLKEYRVTDGRVEEHTRAVTIAEARAHFDSLLYKAGVKPEDWKAAFWCDVPTGSVMLSVRCIEFFHGRSPYAGAGRNTTSIHLRSSGYAG